MKDKTDQKPDDLPEMNDKVKKVSLGRRKLVIGSVPILATFMSRPVWAGGSTVGRCTISGAHSGPSSSHEEETCQGLTPGYWKNGDWPAAFDPGTCTSNGQGQGGGNCTWQNDGTTFQSVFPLCAAELALVYQNLDPGDPSITWDNASLMTILQLHKSGNSTSTAPALQLACHVVAGLLNSAASYLNYGYTAAEFVTLVENFCSNRKLPGYGERVFSIEEFKNLLDARNNGDFNYQP